LNIKNSPYLYNEWKLADITTRDSTVYQHVLLNYNGYEQKFEVIEFKKKVTLDDKLYDNIVVYTKNNDTGPKEWFTKGLHFDIALLLANIIYNGEKLKLIRSFYVRLSETSNELYGDSEIHRKFVQNRTYSILYKSKLQPIKLSKSRLGKIFEDKALINSIVINNNIDLSVEKDLITFFTLLDAQLAK
jgi:hypothetical protein